MTGQEKRLLREFAKARARLDDAAGRDVRVTPSAYGQGGHAGFRPEYDELWDLIVAFDTALPAIHIAETNARVDARAGRMPGLGSNIARDPCR